MWYLLFGKTQIWSRAIKIKTVSGVSEQLCGFQCGRVTLYKTGWRLWAAIIMTYILTAVQKCFNWPLRPSSEQRFTTARESTRAGNPRCPEFVGCTCLRSYSGVMIALDQRNAGAATGSGERMKYNTGTNPASNNQTTKYSRWQSLRPLSRQSWSKYSHVNLPLSDRAGQFYSAWYYISLWHTLSQDQCCCQATSFCQRSGFTEMNDEILVIEVL